MFTDKGVLSRDIGGSDSVVVPLGRSLVLMQSLVGAGDWGRGICGSLTGGIMEMSREESEVLLLHIVLVPGNRESGRDRGLKALRDAGWGHLGVRVGLPF